MHIACSTANQPLNVIFFVFWWGFLVQNVRIDHQSWLQIPELRIWPCYCTLKYQVGRDSLQHSATSDKEKRMQWALGRPNWLGNGRTYSSKNKFKWSQRSEKCWILSFLRVVQPRHGAQVTGNVTFTCRETFYPEYRYLNLDNESFISDEKWISPTHLGFVGCHIKHMGPQVLSGMTSLISNSFTVTEEKEKKLILPSIAFLGRSLH